MSTADIRFGANEVFWIQIKYSFFFCMRKSYQERQTAYIKSLNASARVAEIAWICFIVFFSILPTVSVSSVVFLSPIVIPSPPQVIEQRSKCVGPRCRYFPEMFHWLTPVMFQKPPLIHTIFCWQMQQNNYFGRQVSSVVSSTVVPPVTGFWGSLFWKSGIEACKIVTRKVSLTSGATFQAWSGLFVMGCIVRIDFPLNQVYNSDGITRWLWFRCHRRL